MKKIKCPHCGKTFKAFYEPRFCGICHILLPQKQESKPVKPQKKQEVKPQETKRKKKLSHYQAEGYKTIADRMQMAKSDMINHIKGLIENNIIKWSEFLNDPTMYFSKDIMGVYHKNYILKKSIIRYFEKEYIPF